MRDNFSVAGLTAAETAEFEELENTLPVDELGNPVMSPDQAWRTPQELRWLALYEKHEAARVRLRENKRRLAD